MTNILIVNLNDECDCFASTCILRGLRKKHSPNETRIDVVVATKKNRHIFKNNKHINHVYIPHKFKEKEYDIRINLSAETIKSYKSKEIIGFGTAVGDKLYNILYGSKMTSKNVFQLYYNLAGMKWHGEGYDFYYYPRSRSHKDRIGLSIVNKNLQRYIMRKLKLDSCHLWNIPFRFNLFRKIDEINKCKRIITDDYFVMHLAVFLRKNVYFLKTMPHTTKIELFGNGKVFDIPLAFIK